MKRSETLSPAVDFHEQLAPLWEKKYGGKIFDQRATRFKCLLSQLNVGGQHWIDAGCGTGIIARMLGELGADVTGYDASPKMIEIAKRESQSFDFAGKMDFHCIDTIESLPHEDSSVDAVVCSSVIEYLDSPEVAVAEFCRVLRPEGTIILTVPHRQSLLAYLLKCVFWFTSRFGSEPRPAYMKHSKNQFSERQLKHLLESHGFEDHDVEFTSFWPKAIQLKHFGGICLYRGRKSHH